jgi:hypothetical protein
MIVSVMRARYGDASTPTRRKQARPVALRKLRLLLVAKAAIANCGTYRASDAAVGSGGGISGAFSPQPLSNRAATIIIKVQGLMLFIRPPSSALKKTCELKTCRPVRRYLFKPRRANKASISCRMRLNIHPTISSTSAAVVHPGSWTYSSRPFQSCH